MSNLNVNLVLMMQYMLEITRNSLTIIVYHVLSILCFVEFCFSFCTNTYKCVQSQSQKSSFKVFLFNE